MDNPFQTKLRILYFPYLLYSIGAIGGYSFLNWLLFMRFHSFLLREDIRNFLIPFILPSILLLIFYRPRVKLLRFKDTSRDPATAIVMLAVVSLMAPMIITQDYLATATGKLTKLDQVNEIARVKATRYYTIRNYAIDTAYTRFHLKAVVSGKASQYLDLSLYIVCPIYDKGAVPEEDLHKYPLPQQKGPGSGTDPAGSLPDSVSTDAQQLENTKIIPRVADSASTDTSQSEDTKIVPLVSDSSRYPFAWIGAKYTKEISNRQDFDDKKKSMEEFKNDSRYDYAQHPIRDFTYFDQIPYSDDYLGFQRAVNNTHRFRTGTNLILLEPQSLPFETRNGAKLPWIFGSFAIGAAVYFLILLLIPLDDQKVKAWLSGKPAREKDKTSLYDVLKVFAPRKGFEATPVIIYLNTVVFIIMAMAGLGFIDFSVKDLLAWGGNYGPYISDGQWWRLLTSIFLHGGLMHLVFNMYALLFVGLFLEPVLGRNRFAICYLLTGILASITSYKTHPNGVGVGASGAIFGMYGIFLALLLTNALPPAMKKAFLTSILIFIGYNLLMGLSGNVDNAAHIGGLVGGFIIGLLLNKTIAQKIQPQ